MKPPTPGQQTLARNASVLCAAGLATLVAACPGPAWATRHSPFGATAQTRPANSKARASVFTVAVLGDGFGDALAEGLGLNFANQADVSILNKTQSPFGLSQDDKLEWPTAVKVLLAGHDRIDAAVIMLGANDARPLPDGQATVDPQTPRWRDLYGDRVEAVVALFRAKGIPLTWVGLPIIQDDSLSAGFVALNEIIRDRAVKTGATYVDSWQAFVDEGGRYSAFGPDLNGRMAKLRAADGVDFTRAGVRKLASFVEADLRRDREHRPPAPADQADVVIPDQPEFANALDIDINAQIRREAGLPALPSNDPHHSAARPTPAGPVIPITAPVLAADGHLADVSPARSPLIGGERVLQRSLVEGQPIQPRPGRIDDFSWPRP